MGKKRSTANALHIAKGVGRKGYATTGSVEDENAYLNELQQRATELNQPVPQQQPQGISRVGSGFFEGFGPGDVGISAENRAKYPVLSGTLAGPAYVLDATGRLIMGGAGALSGAVGAGTEALTNDPGYGNYMQRQTRGMFDYFLNRGDVIPATPPRTGIPKQGEVLPPIRETLPEPVRQPVVIDQARSVIEGERPAYALPEPQRALAAPEPQVIAPQEVAPPQSKSVKQPKPPAPEPVRELNPLGFYSRGLEVASTLQPKGLFDEYYKVLKKSVPEPELAGLEEHFAGRPKVTRDELMDFFRQNAPIIEETVYGIPADVRYRLNELEAERNRLKILHESGNMTPEDYGTRMLEINNERADLNSSYKHPKFAEHTMNQVIPGATNYREIVLRNPLRYKGKTVAEWEKVLEKMRTDAIEQDMLSNVDNNPLYSSHQDKLRYDPDYQQALRDRDEATKLEFMNTLDTHWADKRDVAHARVSDRMIPSTGYTIVNRQSGNAAGEVFKTQAEAEAAIDRYPESIRSDLAVQQTRRGPPQSFLHLDEAQYDYAQQLRKYGHVGDEFDVQVKAIEQQIDQMRERHEAEVAALNESRTQELNALKESNVAPEDLEKFNQQLNRRYRDLAGQLQEKFRAEWKGLDDEMKALPETTGFRMGPYGKSDEAMPLLARRMLWEAAQKGQAGIIVTPASEHLKRWGTDGLVWTRDRHDPQSYVIYYRPSMPKTVMDQFAKKNPQEMEGAIPARSQKDFYMKLRHNPNLSEREAFRIAEKVWKQIQNGTESGSMFPRAEGFEYSYHKMLKKYFTEALKEVGVKADIQDFVFPADSANSKRDLLGHKDSPKGAYVINLPPEAIEAINKKGFRSYSQGGAVEMADGGAVEMSNGGMPELVDLETQVPERKWYEPVDLETKVPERTQPVAEPQPPQQPRNPFQETLTPQLVDWDEPVQQQPAAQRPVSPMAYAPPQPSAVGNVAMQAINRSSPRPEPQVFPYQPSQIAGADDVWGRMIKLESGGRQFDRFGRPLRSHAGATGIAQVMPQTGPEAAALANLPWDPQRFQYDADYNYKLGRAYYERQLARYGDPILAAAAYNTGPGNLDRALRRARETGRDWRTLVHPETQNYVRVVSQAQRQQRSEAPPAPVQVAQSTQTEFGAYPTQPKTGVFAFGTNDSDPKTTLEAAQSILEQSKRIGIDPVFILPNPNDRRFAPMAYALKDFADKNGIKYEVPTYDERDPLHMTPRSAQDIAKKYPNALVAGDSNSWRIQRFGYNRPVTSPREFADPYSKQTLGRVGAGSLEIAKWIAGYADYLARQGKKHGGTVVKEALMVVSQKAKRRRGRPD